MIVNPRAGSRRDPRNASSYDDSRVGPPGLRHRVRRDYRSEYSRGSGRKCRLRRHGGCLRVRRGRHRPQSLAGHGRNSGSPCPSFQWEPQMHWRETLACLTIQCGLCPNSPAPRSKRSRLVRLCIQQTMANRTFTADTSPCWPEPGPDGALVYSLLAGKGTLGRTAYYAHAARLFMTRRFPPFRISYRLIGSNSWQERPRGKRHVRPRRRSWRPLQQTHSREFALFEEPTLVLSAATGTGLPTFVVRLRPTWDPPQESVGCEQSKSKNFAANRSTQPPARHVQVDGEWIARLPISVRLVPDALSLLIPSQLPTEELAGVPARSQVS